MNKKVDVTSLLVVLILVFLTTSLITFSNRNSLTIQPSFTNSLSILENEIYLDYYGAAPYSTKQIDKFAELMKSNFCCNNHSPSVCGLRSAELIEQSRKRVLDHFNADDYYLVFTSGCTQALRIIGESFPFTSKSHLYFTTSNHNSVLGIREFAKCHNTSFHSILSLNNATLPEASSPSLFAYPAEDNFNGAQYPLDWIDKIQKKSNWYVLLDAAAYVSHAKLDLSHFKPSFVTISFYKMFGFPTGIGGLFIRKDVMSTLVPLYFGGGTVYASLPNEDYHIFYSEASKFEAGSLPIQSILALPFGFDLIDEYGGVERIGYSSTYLAHHLADNMMKLSYENKQKVFEVYGNHSLHTLQGPVVTFNMFHEDGSIFPTAEINAFMRERNIDVRAGCACNPGSCLHSIGIECKDYIEAVATQPDEELDITTCTDIMVGKKEAGAVRVSLGFGTTRKDVNKFVEAMNELLDKTTTLSIEPVI